MTTFKFSTLSCSFIKKRVLERQVTAKVGKGVQLVSKS